MLDAVRLRVLDAVAQTGSVTAAARKLGYAQPSVSHHLARLEAETGARLVRRVGRGIALTAEGELLAARAREIVGRLDSADQELAAALGLHPGRLRVAAFQSAMSVLIPPAAAAVRECTPGLELRLVEYHPEGALEQLRAGEIDLAVVFRYDDVAAEQGIRYLKLMDDPMYLLSQRPRQTLAHHRDSAWIAGCEYCRRELIDACQEAGFTPHIAFTSEDIVADEALVAAGLGVTTTPGLALRAHQTPGVHASRIDGPVRRVSAATLDEGPQPPLVSAFVNAVRQAIDSLDRIPNTTRRPRTLQRRGVTRLTAAAE